MSELIDSHLRNLVLPALAGLAVAAGALAEAPSAEAVRTTATFNLDGARAEGALSMNTTTGLGRCAVKVRANTTNYGQEVSGLMRLEDRVDGHWVEDPVFDAPPVVTAKPTPDGKSYKFVTTHDFSVREMRRSAQTGPLRIACYAGDNKMTLSLSASQFKKPQHGKTK